MNCSRGLLLGAVLLSGHLAAGNPAYRELAWQFDLPGQIEPDRFAACSQHNCQTRTPVRLDSTEWADIRAFFLPPADSAAAERAQIAAAIGRMEQLVAQRTNAAHDKGGNFSGFGLPGAQLDCVDESVNSTTYLTLFEQQGLLRWHRVVPRLHRGLLLGRWPHFSAAVATRDAQNEQWAVDSWFRDNGSHADIVPAALWRQGWEPEQFSR